jgi:hypothetical protein
MNAKLGLTLLVLLVALNCVLTWRAHAAGEERRQQLANEHDRLRVLVDRLEKVPEGGRTETATGKVTLNSGETLEVVYPFPFVQPPGPLVKSEQKEVLKIVERKPDRFKITNVYTSPVSFEWEAVGVRAPAP